MTASTSLSFRVIGEIIRKDGSKERVIGNNDFQPNIDAFLLDILSSIDIIGWLKLKNLNDGCLLHTLLQEKQQKAYD